LGIIFMCLGIPKVYEESIAQKLSDVTLITLNDFGTHLLVCTHHVTPVFRVELAGEFRGVHEVTEHHRELPTFRFGCVWFERWCNLRGLIVLDRRLLGWLSRERGDFLSASSVARPDEPPPVIISHRVHVEKFCFEGFEILVI